MTTSNKQKLAPSIHTISHSGFEIVLPLSDLERLVRQASLRRRLEAHSSSSVPPQLEDTSVPDPFRSGPIPLSSEDLSPKVHELISKGVDFWSALLVRLLESYQVPEAPSEFPISK